MYLFTVRYNGHKDYFWGKTDKVSELYTRYDLEPGGIDKVYEIEFVA